MKNHLKTIIICIGILAIIVLIVLSLKYDIINNGNAVTMISGFWSAFATVILGLVAFWQNKQYKKLSDKTSQDLQDIQEDIRMQIATTQETVEVIKRIELAIYQPVLEEIYYYYFMEEGQLIEDVFDDVFVHQKNYCNLANDNGFHKEYSDSLKDNNTILFGFRNTSEKTILNFICKEITINDKQISMLQSFGCDIPLNKCVLISIINCPKISENEIIPISMKFSLKNIIQQEFIFDVSLLYTKINNAPSLYIEEKTLLPLSKAIVK